MPGQLTAQVRLPHTSNIRTFDNRRERLSPLAWTAHFPLSLVMMRCPLFSTVQGCWSSFLDREADNSRTSKERCFASTQ